jgi:glucose-6-phosphate 1-epimerase
MPADGYERMVCLEAAQIGTPVVLLPGQAWSGAQTLRLL